MANNLNYKNKKHYRLAILAEGFFSTSFAKTAIGVIRYSDDEVVCVIDSTKAGKSSDEVIGIGKGIPIVKDIYEALKYNPTALLIGIAPLGGKLPEEWKEIIKVSLKSKLDIISGLHTFLSLDDEFSQLSNEYNCKIYDIRMPPKNLPIAGGKGFGIKPTVILTVGSDCDVGKMTVAVEIHKSLINLGKKSRFIATGQTGIMIEKYGYPIDAIVGDFMAGAIEELIINCEQDNDFIIVEGQGSLFHQGYSGVTLALLHGCAPDAMIFCHQPSRDKIGDPPFTEFPPLPRLIEIYEEAASWIKPAKVVGIALNTYKLSELQAKREIDRAEILTNLQADDVIRFNGNKLAKALVDYANQRNTILQK